MRMHTGFPATLFVVVISSPLRGQTGAPAPPDMIPSTIQLCETPSPNPFRIKNCATLTWNGQRYDGEWHGVENAISKGAASQSTVAVTLDKDGNIRLDRTDVAGTVGATGTYLGKITPDGKISGTATWYANGVIFAKGKWNGTVTLPAPQEAAPPQSAPAPPPSGDSPPPPPGSDAQNAGSLPAPEGAVFPFLIKIEETVTEPTIYAGYHHSGKLVWAGKVYSSSFQPLAGPNGGAVDAQSLGTAVLTESGRSFTLKRQDFQGTEGKAEYSGTMETATHGSGSVVWTNQFGTFKGKFTADFDFTSAPGK